MSEQEFTRTRASLDRSAKAGGTLRFWWRDDDATTPSADLDRLLELRKEASVPLALAVIARDADAALATRLSQEPNVAVLQHGYSHANHAPNGRKRAEFGDDRPAAIMSAEIAEGHRRLTALFGKRFVPIFVPPWNRIGEEAVRSLTTMSLRGLSTYGRADRENLPPNLRMLNTHCDLMAWHPARGLSIDELDCLVAEKINERLDESPDRQLANFDEPIGILTHHLQHDETAWRSLATLLRLLSGHPAASWCPIKELR